MSLKETLQLQASQNPELAKALVGCRLLRTGEELQWTGPDVARVQSALFTAIGELPDRLYDVILARYGGGLSLSDYSKRIDRSRERARQLEAKAIRLMRAYLYRMDLAQTVEESITVAPVPGGPFDPAWVSVKEAAELTDLALDHIRRRAREGYLKARVNEYRRNEIQIQRASLKRYVFGESTGGRGRRRRGIWKGDDA